MEYIVTFHTHYGAMRYHKYCAGKGDASRMAPVPRALSSSCGVCVYVKTEQAPSIEGHVDVELCYIVEPGGAYRRVCASA